MPVMDGFELVERIRQLPDRSLPAIMMLTSSSQRGDAARCRALGIAAYLTKPIKQSALLDGIMTIVGATELEGSKTSVMMPDTARKGMSPLRVLLAEDNLVNRTIAIAMLTKRGHTVVAATNGVEVLKILESQGAHAFDLLLMDVQMPELDGLETTGRIRENERTAGGHIPIIALTARAIQGDKELCLDAGMDAYVSKPLKADDLLAAIERVVSPRRAADSGAPDLARPVGREKGVFDERATLASVDHDTQLLAEVVETFVEERPNVLSKIGLAIQEGNASDLGRAAHALKGSVGVFGARRAGAMADKLAMMGKRGDLRGAQAVHGALVEEIERVAQAPSAFVERVRS
jgi:CheY-like chemotaxis protein/HPt (histidine-containing phosphotransfer) domain-containing protein